MILRMNDNYLCFQLILIVSWHGFVMQEPVLEWDVVEYIVPNSSAQRRAVGLVVQVRSLFNGEVFISSE